MRPSARGGGCRARDHGGEGVRYLSLCSGIESATVAWKPLGFTAVGFADIDPYACELLAQHYPDVPNLGDLTLITAERVAELGPIDIVVGGTPCQDLSVAGARRGIEGERSGIFFDFVRIFDAARRFCGARWCLWENVPGAFSSNAGRDFARVVGALAGSEVVAPRDGWGSEGVAVGERGLVEWAVLDAQWFNLAQRRARVFALLDTGDWASREPVLLEPDSVRGDFAPSRETGADSPAGALRSTDGGCDVDHAQAGHLLIQEVADPLVTAEGSTYTHEGENNFRVRNVVLSCFDETQVTHPENRSTADPETAALAKTARPPSIALRADSVREGVAKTPSADAEGRVRLRDPGFNVMIEHAPTLDTAGVPFVMPSNGVAVRRLTPRECERLQGFPDDYTAVTYRKKPASDTARYAGLGNSKATTVVRWVGERLQRVHRRTHG
jgi:DNA (cytosine-5)-methyltransferase 1